VRQLDQGIKSDKVHALQKWDLQGWVCDAEGGGHGGGGKGDSSGGNGDGGSFVYDTYVVLLVDLHVQRVQQITSPRQPNRFNSNHMLEEESRLQQMAQLHAITTPEILVHKSHNHGQYREHHHYQHEHEHEQLGVILGCPLNRYTPFNIPMFTPPPLPLFSSGDDSGSAPSSTGTVTGTGKRERVTLVSIRMHGSHGSRNDHGHDHRHFFDNVTKHPPAITVLFDSYAALLPPVTPPSSSSSSSSAETSTLSPSTSPSSPTVAAPSLLLSSSPPSSCEWFLTFEVEKGYSNQRLG
jgi:hypothetical protein